MRPALQRSSTRVGAAPQGPAALEAKVILTLAFHTSFTAPGGSVQLWPSPTYFCKNTPHAFHRLHIISMQPWQSPLSCLLLCKR